MNINIGKCQCPLLGSIDHYRIMLSICYTPPCFDGSMSEIHSSCFTYPEQSFIPLVAQKSCHSLGLDCDAGHLDREHVFSQPRAGNSTSFRAESYHVLYCTGARVHHLHCCTHIRHPWKLDKCLKSIFMLSLSNIEPLCMHLLEATSYYGSNLLVVSYCHLWGYYNQVLLLLLKSSLS